VASKKLTIHSIQTRPHTYSTTSAHPPLFISTLDTISLDRGHPRQRPHLPRRCLSPLHQLRRLDDARASLRFSGPALSCAPPPAPAPLPLTSRDNDAPPNPPFVDTLDNDAPPLSTGPLLWGGGRADDPPAGAGRVLDLDAKTSTTAGPNPASVISLRGGFDP
jgi:hypothetical protein